MRIMSNQGPDLPSEKWHVAHCLPHKEASVQLRLQDQGYETFVPMLFRTIRHARRLTTVKRPVFPRYVFVKFDARKTQWRSINGTRGVQRLIMRGDAPEAVRRGIVETLISSVDEEEILQFKDALRPGDKVRLLSGPFANELGTLRDLKPGERVVVLLSFVKGSVPVETDRSAVARAV